MNHTVKTWRFALPQDTIGKELSLNQCGSQFDSDTESRYAAVELELLAVTWSNTETACLSTRVTRIHPNS